MSLGRGIPGWTVEGMRLRLGRLNRRAGSNWARVGAGFMPFADAATAELPMRRLLRLSLFQVTVGMAVVLLIGTLNRVMIVELGVPAWLVAAMVSLPLVFAPLRAVIGFKSDTHRSVLGWRRVPYLWFGTLLQFGGLSIMPFALILLSGDTNGPAWIGQAAAALAFLLVGAGLHTVQTVGLALATDLAPQKAQPRVVALLCMMMLLGMIGSALVFGALLAHFSQIRLIQVIQGAAVVTMVLNAVALWKQEPRDSARTSGVTQQGFVATWRAFAAGDQARRRLVALGFGTVAFSMQDILLEPYGGHVMHLSVGSTTAMTALLAGGGAVRVCGGGAVVGAGGGPVSAGGVCGFGGVGGVFGGDFCGAVGDLGIVCFGGVRDWVGGGFVCALHADGGDDVGATGAGWDDVGDLGGGAGFGGGGGRGVGRVHPGRGGGVGGCRAVGTGFGDAGDWVCRRVCDRAGVVVRDARRGWAAGAVSSCFPFHPATRLRYSHADRLDHLLHRCGTAGALCVLAVLCGADLLLAA